MRICTFWKTLFCIIPLVASAVIGDIGLVPQALGDDVAARPIRTPKPGPGPKINSPAVYGCRPGRPFLYRIPCTGVRPMTFAAEQLPEGLTVDSQTGIISGKVPAKKGAYAMVLRAGNAAGEDQRTMKIVVGDTLALTPFMGWNSWYAYYLTITQAEMCKQADALVASGMADFGYQYVNIDDCWMKKNGEPPYRDEKGNMLPNAHFPDMKGLADYLHAKGLKAGIYSAAGPWTCANYVGSYQHEEADVKQYAAWGYDFLKYDTCSYMKLYPDMTLEQLQTPFRKIGNALKNADRDIVYNPCPMVLKLKPWEWAAEVGGNSWRTDRDINNEPAKKLPGLYRIGMSNASRREYAKPGHWNDPDYILIGYFKHTKHRDKPPMLTPLTAEEQYSYMSMWCLMAAPLIYSGDMTKLDEFTLNVLCNAEVIAIDQDALGIQGRAIRQTAQEFILAKPLEDGSLAVGLFNLDEQARNMAVRWEELGLQGPQTARDPWRQKDLEGTHQGEFKTLVEPHGVELVRFRPVRR